jgi:acyl-CoA synthetase (AMP-forming)/AMP-acid ligase II
MQRRMVLAKPECSIADDLPAPSSIVDALLARARQDGRRTAFTVVESERSAIPLGCGELLERALQASAALKEHGLRRGDRILVCLPTSVDLLIAIYGTLLAGGVCVPIYPPLAREGLRRWKEQVRAVALVAQPCGAVVSATARLHMAATLELCGEDLFTVTPAQLAGAGAERPQLPLPEDLAFIQFTSGTTREPRGVSVSHAALFANMRALLAVMALGPEDVSVSWLPPYHDMGLVGHIFVPILGGVHQLLMPPAALLRNPVRWLELVTRAEATQTTAPNFAYSMCARRISRSERARLDLSSLRWALNGSETVLAETLDAFAQTFAASGFRREAFRPVYGLAEATLAASFSPEGGGRVDWVDRSWLAEHGEARPAEPDHPDAQPFVSVGLAIPGHELRVAGDGGEPLEARQVGEICFRGPSVTSGYFNNPQATRDLFQDGWLLTGDLGYLDEEDRLHVTGRRKEIIIKSGRNYLPQDFEAACLGSPALRPGRAVAFGLTNRRTGTEDLVLVAEVRDPARVRDPLLVQRIARLVAERTGVRPDRVELAPPGLIPKTTSGKLQRGRVRAAYEAGIALRPPPRAPVDVAVEAVRSLVDLAAAKLHRIFGWQ